MTFEILAKDSKTRARLGKLQTPHGAVETPVFMPVATLGSVKALSQEDLQSLGVRAILSNSYHLYLRPGTDVVKTLGGLHKFMGYDGMILTDSGGFQVMSLSELRKITDHGVEFRSHLDGSSHNFTPEKVIQIQSELGSDCWTTLDVCAPYPSSLDETRRALERTINWTDRSVPEFLRKREGGSPALFFPILQGGLVPELRREAAEHMRTVPADGIALGGFSVGEPKQLTWEVLAQTVAALPDEKPRYLMGVGTPEDLWNGFAQGVDMMDCVYPTRIARNGEVFTRHGELNVTRTSYRKDTAPLDPDCGCFVCRRYSRAYLAHLHRSKELTVYHLLSYHNLHFMAEVVGLIRRSINEGRFDQARREFLDALSQSPSSEPLKT